MPPKKKPVEDEDGMEGALSKWGVGVKTFRTGILFLILSMHPIGRGFLKSFGFEFQDEKKITVAAEDASSVKTEIQSIARDVTEMKNDVTQLKANNSILNVKVDNLDKTFSGFQIDFQKYRVPQEEPANATTTTPK